jgi:hypothetical protein
MTCDGECLARACLAISEDGAVDPFQGFRDKRHGRPVKHLHSRLDIPNMAK